MLRGLREREKVQVGMVNTKVLQCNKYYPSFNSTQGARLIGFISIYGQIFDEKQ